MTWAEALGPLLDGHRPVAIVGPDSGEVASALATDLGLRTLDTGSASVLGAGVDVDAAGLPVPGSCGAVVLLHSWQDSAGARTAVAGAVSRVRREGLVVAGDLDWERLRGADPRVYHSVVAYRSLPSAAGTLSRQIVTARAVAAELVRAGLRRVRSDWADIERKRFADRAAYRTWVEEGGWHGISTVRDRAAAAELFDRIVPFLRSTGAWRDVEPWHLSWGVRRA